MQVEVYVNEIKNKDERLQHEWYSRLNQKIQVLRRLLV